jgi:hypothetical protein
MNNPTADHRDGRGGDGGITYISLNRKYKISPVVSGRRPCDTSFRIKELEKFFRNKPMANLSSTFRKKLHKGKTWLQLSASMSLMTDVPVRWTFIVSHHGLLKIKI